MKSAQLRRDIRDKKFCLEQFLHEQLINPNLSLSDHASHDISDEHRG
jgi:hypothetical protein